MTSDAKKAAEEYAEGLKKSLIVELQIFKEPLDVTNQAIIPAFLAGDAHGFARAVKMLEDAGYVEHPKTGKCIAAREWAAWLEEQEKGK